MVHKKKNIRLRTKSDIDTITTPKKKKKSKLTKFIHGTLERNTNIENEYVCTHEKGFDFLDDIKICIEIK